MTNVSEVKVQKFDGTRDMPLHPLLERRLIIHLSGEVEITTSDGSKQVLRAGDMRLMDDVTGKGHAYLDLTPSEAVYIILND
jgi:redox-sensitive bicupin YhaK (pirin superfamily)